MEKKVVLTGIKPTGMPHIGNYFGAIRPAIDMSKDYLSRFFIADYHSLNGLKDPEQLREYIYQIAACWLACGLNPEETLLYRQSGVPETFELTTIIMAFTPKGLMNRAHAYKASVDQNREKGKPEDHNINMGLYTYPVLMAADILLFDTNLVPVGKDQVQHIEMTVDIAEAVNRNYKENLLTLPQAVVSESTQTIIGLDGRKMSKSYGNTIPLFLPEKKLKKLLNKIVTNSQDIEEPKDPDTCNVFTLYKLFSTQEEQNALAGRYRAGGLGWGHAKAELFEKMNSHIKPMRDEYDRLMADKGFIEETLRKGEAQARELASQKIQRLRKAIGIEA